MSLTFNVSGFQAVPVDIPVRLSGFLERGRPRPLNPPLMQTQPVLVWFGLKGEQDVFAVLDCWCRKRTGTSALR